MKRKKEGKTLKKKIRRPNHLRLCTYRELVRIALTRSPDYIFSPYSPGSGDTVIKALSYYVPPLPGKEIKPLSPSPS